MSDRPQSPKRKHFFPRMGGPGNVHHSGEDLPSWVLNDSNPVKTTKTRSGPNVQSHNDATAEEEFDPGEYESPFPQYAHDADNCTDPSVCPLHSPLGFRFGGMPTHPQLGRMHQAPCLGDMYSPPYFGGMGPSPYLRGMGPYFQGMDQPSLFRDMPPRSYPRDGPFTPPSLNLNRPSGPDMPPSARALRARARARRTVLKSFICDSGREDIALMLTVCVMAWLWDSPPSVPFSEPMANMALWMAVWCVGLQVLLDGVAVWEERRLERNLVEMERRDKEQIKEKTWKEGRDGAAASGASGSAKTEGEAEWEMA
ncbi:hypothetical protein BS50DRAFT_631405 [Corynespora cassiicola Philippines]|uniref:Uncharacterized protein n=1 Tax=Corynespora cassiicola Philippines TaxID=1448308 RepID=A0A2T2P196_CORCC|nr:hypothetical protein BS50DRAFT_631405 [Corynespora cassiicola Philippines]